MPEEIKAAVVTLTEAANKIFGKCDWKIKITKSGSTITDGYDIVVDEGDPEDVASSLT